MIVNLNEIVVNLKALSVNLVWAISNLLLHVPLYRGYVQQEGLHGVAANLLEVRCSSLKLVIIFSTLRSYNEAGVLFLDSEKHGEFLYKIFKIESF